MTSRSFRLETRSRAKDETKRIVQSVEKVRKWEKRWIELGLSNSLKVYKWVPVREETRDEEDNKENQPMDLSEQPPQAEPVQQDSSALPEIISAPSTTDSSLGLVSSQIVCDQAPPSVLLVSEENSNAVSNAPSDPSLSLGDRQDNSRDLRVASSSVATGLPSASLQRGIGGGGVRGYEQQRTNGGSS